MKERFLKIDKGIKNLFIIAFSGVLTALCIDLAVYAYYRHERINHYPSSAKVLELEYFRPGTGYGRILKVAFLVEQEKQLVRKVINDGGSNERSEFVKRTHVGDRIVVWVDRRNGEISLFEPVAKLFGTLWFAWFFGMWGSVIAALVVGETQSGTKSYSKNPAFATKI